MMENEEDGDSFMRGNSNSKLGINAGGGSLP